MNWVADIGNTRVKLASFDDDNLQEQWLLASTRALYDLIESHKPQRVLVSTVRDEQVPSLSVPVMKLHSALPMPFQSDYETPETLGQDRMALAAAAAGSFPNMNVLVIDAGTCVTYDLIQKGRYLGGAIAPGLQMRSKSMHAFTGKLPEVVIQNGIPEGVGRSTKACLELGAFRGWHLEMEGFIQAYGQQFPGLKVVLTGGDAERFEKASNYSIFADPNFLLKGLNIILKHNASAF